MSLWFRRRDKQGRVHWYGVDVSILIVLTVTGFVIALVLLFAAWLRGP